ncbi:MAG: hypothetical protein CL477_02400 [Acidobacteria bacterium]|jgi:predicted CopG family antitoxin|nr:hypothetical protein [Acidobacteriota bacterium]HJN45077.1 antitoxin VapB family protein [Vicinamibacterales bacterium]|tara:strand:- start:760 stop:1005 length:246 start_codon:yes stop_codon:yes gene_type:complete
MPRKTITLDQDAYEKLKRAMRSPRESFSSVVRRGRWAHETTTGREVLAALEALSRTHPEALLGDDTLGDIERRSTRSTVWA